MKSPKNEEDEDELLKTKRIQFIEWLRGSVAHLQGSNNFEMLAGVDLSDTG